MTTNTYDPNRKPPTLRTEIIITVIGLIGIILGVLLADQAFTSAAIDLDLSRQEVIARATDELKQMGYDPAGYQFALVFQQAFYGSIYTERTLGVAETNHLLQNESLPLFYWSARWFRPLQKEEFSVELSPQGQLLTFQHTISEDDPGADLPEEQAQQLAEAYLQKLGWSLDQLTLLSSSSELKPGGRRDHTFVWERTDLTIGDGELRVEVKVQGDKADGYDYWLKSPDAFRRDFDIQRNRAGFINSVALFLAIFGLGTATAAVFVLAGMRKINVLRRNWPWILLVAVIILLAELNYMPLSKYSYVTTEDYSLFWVNQFIGLPILAVAVFVLIGMIWGGGHQLSKLVWPMQDRVLPRGANRWVEFSRSAWRGLMLSGWMFGYLIIFYYIANNLLGWWSPMDGPSVNIFGTPFPFLGALETGLFPGTWEELLFRLVGISLILWITRGRHTWLALLLPGLMWAAGHAGYITDPIYVRVIELTIAAVFIEGLFFLRFGLLTTIIAHTTYNATLVALPMLSSNEPYFMANGLAVLAFLTLPLLPGIFITIRRKRRKETTPATPEINSATPEDLAALMALPVSGMAWEMLLTEPSVIIICARQHEQVIGAAIGRVLSEGSAEIQWVFVTPAWRNQFLGSQLVEALRQRFQALQIENIRVTLPIKEKRGTSFFASQGWETTSQTFVPKPPLTFGQAVRNTWEEIREARKNKE